MRSVCLCGFTKVSCYSGWAFTDQQSHIPTEAEWKRATTSNYAYKWREISEVVSYIICPHCGLEADKSKQYPTLLRGFPGFRRAKIVPRLAMEHVERLASSI